MSYNYTKCTTMTCAMAASLLPRCAAGVAEVGDGGWPAKDRLTGVQARLGHSNKLSKCGLHPCDAARARVSTRFADSRFFYYPRAFSDANLTTRLP